MRRHALFILGMFRSGASVLASALVKAGAAPGRTLRAIPEVTSEDSGECAPVVALSDEVLRELGSRWDSLAPLPDRWTERPGVRTLAERALEVVRAEFPQGEAVVVKDARISRVFAFWREAFEAAGFDVTVALMLRRPGEVAASLARHDPVAPEKSLALWLSYLAEAERATRGVTRVLVTYDRLLDAPAGTLAHVGSATRLPLRIEGAAREAALAAIAPDLRQQGGEGRAALPLALGSGLDRVLDEGYERLARLPPGIDPRREVEALLQAASPAMTAAIPPWLARELDADREAAARQAEALRAAQQEIAAMKAAQAQAQRAAAARDRNEAELRARVDQLSKTGSSEGRDTRIDEALATLRADVSRIAYTLADQPAREQALRLELAQAQRDLGDERATIGKLSEELEQARGSMLALQQQVEAARGHIQALVEELEQARAADAARDAHEGSLQQELDAARDEARTLQSERDALRKERDQAVRRLDALLPEAEALRRDFAVASKERDALAREAAQVGDALVALREELARRVAAESALSGERDRLQAELRAATERAGALEREVAKRAAELVALGNRGDALARTLGAVERHWLGRIALKGARRG